MKIKTSTLFLVLVLGIGFGCFLAAANSQFNQIDSVNEVTLEGPIIFSMGQSPTNSVHTNADHNVFVKQKGRQLFITNKENFFSTVDININELKKFNISEESRGTINDMEVRNLLVNCGIKSYVELNNINVDALKIVGKKESSIELKKVTGQIFNLHLSKESSLVGYYSRFHYFLPKLNGESEARFIKSKVVHLTTILENKSHLAVQGDGGELKAVLNSKASLEYAGEWQLQQIKTSNSARAVYKNKIS